MITITVEKDGRQEVVRAHCELPDVEATYFEEVYGIDMRRRISEHIGRELVTTIERVVKGE